MGIFDSDRALSKWVSGWYSVSFDKEIGFSAGYQAAVDDYLKYMTGNSDKGES